MIYQRPADHSVSPDPCYVCGTTTEPRTAQSVRVCVYAAPTHGHSQYRTEMWSLCARDFREIAATEYAEREQLAEIATADQSRAWANYVVASATYSVSLLEMQHDTQYRHLCAMRQNLATATTEHAVNVAALDSVGEQVTDTESGRLVRDYRETRRNLTMAENAHRIAQNLCNDLCDDLQTARDQLADAIDELAAIS